MTRTNIDGTEPVNSAGSVSNAGSGTGAGSAASLDFDGTPVPFTPGQTIGGALAGAGIVSWRTTRRDHAPRGLFCGIGVCFDCLVTVDGLRSQRACLVEACAGQDVRSADPDEPLPLEEPLPESVPPSESPSEPEESHD